MAKFPCFALGLAVSLHEYSREDIFCFIYGPSERWVLDNGATLSATLGTTERFCIANVYSLSSNLKT